MFVKPAVAGALALVLSTPAVAAPPTLAETVQICRTAFFIDPAKGKAMFDAVPEEHKRAVALICLSYRQGAQDMLRVIQQSQPKPRPVKWGG